MSLVKEVLSNINFWGSESKNFFYDTGFLDPVQLKTPIISIGNLTMGGTGKTPLIHLLAEHFLKSGFRPGIVSRSYKASESRTTKVDVNRLFAAQAFGDEPVWLAQKLEGVPVYISKEKWKAAESLEENEKVDVMLVDDGFQHRILQRDLDIVLVDASGGLKELELFPRGRGREIINNLNRADWLFLTKSSELPAEELKIIKSYLLNPNKVIQVISHLQDIPLEDAGKKVILFSGIAKNNLFFESVKNETMYNVLSCIEFSDHHNYTDLDIKKLLAKKHELDADLLITTEKDWVKIQSFINSTDDFKPLAQKITLDGPVEEFYVDLDQTLGKNSELVR